MRAAVLLWLLGCAGTRASAPVTAPTAAPQPAQDAAEGAPPDAEVARLREALEADATGDAARARTLFGDLVTGATDPRVRAFAAERFAEIDLIGRDAAALDIDRWYTPRTPALSDAPLTVLVFFESWCPHCQEELPKLPALACRWEPRGAQVVLLTKRTRGVTDADVQRDIVTHGLFGLAVGHERDGAMSTAYAVTGIPAAAVVKQGQVVWRGHPAELDDTAMGAWLGASPSDAPCPSPRAFGR